MQDPLVNVPFSEKQSAMTTQRLYIHVGLPKTGTTSIQQYFADNAETLLQLHNLYYCHGYTSNSNNCFDIFPLTWKGTAFLRKKSQEAARKNYRYFLISDEQAPRGGACALIDAIPVLQDIFPGHEIKIILYLRRADDWCKSHYQQALTRARTDGCERTFAAFCRSPRGLKSELFSLPQTIRTLAVAFGRENLIIRLYDRKSMKNGSSLDDFADIFGINIPMGIPGERLPGEWNPSLPVEALPYLAPLTDTNSPLPLDIRKKLISIIKASFEHSRIFKAIEIDRPKVERTIDELEEWAPGYKKLYEEREFSLDWPELRLNPDLLAMSEVLYHIVLLQH